MAREYTLRISDAYPQPRPQHRLPESIRAAERQAPNHAHHLIQPRTMMNALTTSDPTSASTPNTSRYEAPAAIGRPRALDEVKLGQICSLVSAGFGLEKVARYVGCAASTIRREARRNREFGQQLRRASMASELEALRAIQRAAGTHWRAAAWLLKQTEPAGSLQQQGNARRIRRPVAQPWEPSEREQFISEIHGILARNVTDNALLCQLVQQVQQVDAQATALNRKPPTDPEEIPPTEHQPEASARPAGTSAQTTNFARLPDNLEQQ